jgi:hypothetical protein
VRIASIIAMAIAGISAMIVIAAHSQMNTALSADTKSAPVEDARGDLRVPDAYRETYQLLGSWAIAADQGSGAKELHVVYASPGAIDVYRRDRHFPNNTVLVKEVYQAATANMTTGTVSHANALKGWFVMVKDNDGRHVGNDLWGDGWGWSWFDAANSSKTTSTDYTLNCKSCHVPARATDWIYVDGYPALKR